MTSGMDWFKLFPSYLDNVRLTILPEHIQMRFIKLYMLAAQSDDNGVINLKHEEIAFKLRISLEDLHKTYDTLHAADPEFFCNNGNGPEVPVFRSEQVSKEAREKKREDAKARQVTHRNKSRISNALVTQQSQESESESELRESESEVRKDEESSVSQSSQPATADDLHTHDKKEICTLAGIPPKFSKSILENHNGLITPADLLSELARNYSRKNVKNPGYITGMNLARVTPERPGAEWYDPTRWTKHLPAALRQKLGSVIQSAEDDLTNSGLLAIRNNEVEDKVKEFLEGHS